MLPRVLVELDVALLERTDTRNHLSVRARFCPLASSVVLLMPVLLGLSACLLVISLRDVPDYQVDLPQGVLFRLLPA